MNRSAQMRAHAKKRAQERFSVHLNQDSYYNICKKIRANQATFLEKQSNHITKWLVEISPGVLAPVIYDKKRKLVVTVLPLE